MKTIKTPISMLIILVGMMTISGCKKDDPEPLNQVQLNKLSKMWQVTSVRLDGVDNTSYYDGVSFQILGTNPDLFSYTVTDRPHYSPWPPSGTFAFGSDVSTTLVRDKGTAEELTITYTVSDTTLELKFAFSGDPYNARTEEVNGQWVFVFGL